MGCFASPLTKKPYITMKKSKLDKYNPITLKVEMSFTFLPDDSLPPDFKGNREDAVEYLKEDLAENFALFANPRDIYHYISEEE
jgi:hypothetical protein